MNQSEIQKYIDEANEALMKAIETLVNASNINNYTEESLKDPTERKATYDSIDELKISIEKMFKNHMNVLTVADIDTEKLKSIINIVLTNVDYQWLLE